MVPPPTVIRTKTINPPSPTQKFVASSYPPVTPVITSDAFTTISPEKAKPFLDTPEGFGEWHMFISSAAVRHLRDFRRRDQEIYGIILKKIQQISHGHFSESNQKRLRGGDGSGAIFEAKMTSDLRLVYQIDLHSDLKAKVRVSHSEVA